MLSSPEVSSSLWSAAYHKGRGIFSPSAPEEAGDLQTGDGPLPPAAEFTCDLAMPLAGGPRQPGVEPSPVGLPQFFAPGARDGGHPSAGPRGLGGSYLHVQ